MYRFSSWLKASRTPAQAFIFPSLLLGQGIYYHLSGEFSWKAFFLVHTYGLFMHLFIVYANDYADYQTDQANKTYTPFTGGSRVLVEGKLKHKDLFIAAIIMSVMTLSVGLLISIITFNIYIPLFVLLGLLLLYSYSFKPVMLSYRGFGEVLQMTGVGVILPLIGYMAQGGSLISFPWITIAVLLPAQLAMAVSTSLPDELSDKQSLKRTTVVIIGAAKARMLIIGLYLLSFAVIALKQEISLSVRQGQLFALLFGLLIASQLMLSIFFSVKAGSKSLFLFVLLSILTNTTFVLWITYSMFVKS